jgi:PAS domain S-box-containing protein
LAAASGVFILALGLSVLAGWFFHVPALFQLRPEWPPVTRNAAACFVLCGLALLIVVDRKPNWMAVACAGLVGTVSLLTIVEYIFGVNAGIDELLGPAYVTVTSSSPGRMYPAAASCFAVASLVLLLAPKIQSKRYGLLLGLSGSIIAAVGIATIMSFELGSSDAFGWSHVTRATPLTAVGLWVLGVGMLALAWRVETEPVWTPRWLPISVTIALATIIVGLWQALIAGGYGPTALLPAVVLAGGGLLALILGLTVYTVQRAHAQATALRSTEARKAAILETALDCIMTIDHEGRITEFNPAAERTFGYRRDEVVGKRLAEVIIPPALREQHARGFARYLATGEARVLGRRIEITGVRADGSEFPVELAITRIPSDGPPSFTGYLRDITERKHSEAELRRSEALLAGAQRISSTGSFSWRVATDEIRWSEEAYRIYGIDPGVPVTFDLIRSRVHPDNLPMLEDVIDHARREGGDFDYESCLLMPDGSVKYVHVVAHGSRNQAGELELIGAVQDVTERRRSEDALSKARSELTHVARVTSLGALTASIAHEVNQPLSGIITNASTCLLMLAADPPNVDGARETARRTIRDGNRAAGVIARLRALFGKKDAPNELVDLNEAAREVMALSSSELRRNGVIVDSALVDGLGAVTGDRIQLQQVILNLLLNASDAMSGVDDRPRQLLIMTEQDGGNRVRLSVRDTGVGFDPEGVDRLFEAFYTTKSSGMGMGLSISRSIIENHHGRLWAALNDGPGATFSFSVPCTPAAATSPPTPSVLRVPVGPPAQLQVMRNQ